MGDNWREGSAVEVNRDVLRIYKRVLAVPEGLSGKEHRRLVRKYVREMSLEEVEDIRSRSDEIEERNWDVWLLSKEILMRLGFSNDETQVLARCRLNSPGMRTLIKERVAVTKYATDKEIQAINNGNRVVFWALRASVRRKNDKAIR